VTDEDRQMKGAIRAFHSMLVAGIQKAGDIAAAGDRRQCIEAEAQRDDMINTLTRHNGAFQAAGIVRPLAIVRRESR